MAKPEGAVNAGGYYHDIDGFTGRGLPAYMYFVFRIPWMPAAYNDNGEDYRPMRLKCSVNATIYDDDAGDDINLYVQYYLGNKKAVSTQTYVGGAATPEYKTAVEQTNVIVNEYSFNAYQGGSASTNPRYVVCKLVAYTSTPEAGDYCYIYGAEFEAICDDPNTTAIEQLDRAGLSDMVFQPDYPASSHLIMEGLCDTFNRYLAENRPYWYIPVLGFAP